MIALNRLGKVALVTDVRPGIGAAVCRTLAADGVNVALPDLAGYITGQSIFVDGGRTFCRDHEGTKQEAGRAMKKAIVIRAFFQRP